MKRVFQTILLLTFFAFSAKSQIFKAGVIAGISASQVEGDGYGGYNKIGAIAGGFTNTSIAENASLQLEIYFINKGSQKNPNTSQGDVDAFNLNLNYIDIPLVLRYHYKKFLFEGGIYGSRFLNYSMSDENGKRDVGNFPFKSYDAGGFLGINYAFAPNFLFNLRSKNSLVPVRELYSLDQQIGILNKLFNQGWYNLDLNFSIRYQFGGNE